MEFSNGKSLREIIFAFGKANRDELNTASDTEFSEEQFEKEWRYCFDSRRKPLYREMASMIVAYNNCVRGNNGEWENKWRERLEDIEKNQLPSGSGIDNGTKINWDKSDGKKRIVLETAFHHMNDNGFYDGWTEHTITITPSFDGFDLSIGGRDRNDIKDYLYEVFSHCLSEMIEV